ncbi:MAG: diguanylate cyclase [Idiomarina sp.]|nr:diguanylate cyclase [Idiomarina sp.]
MHLPTLVGIILLLNFMLGGLLFVIYQLRSKQRCFLYWAISCWVFVLGGAFAAAREFIELPWLTHWLASILLITSPLLAVRGIQFFRSPNRRHKWLAQLLFLAGATLLIGALYPIYPWISPLTSLVIAGVFAWAVYLLMQIKSPMQLPQRLLCIFFVLHVAIMLLQAISMIFMLVNNAALPLSASSDPGIIAGASVELADSAAITTTLLTATFISHLLLTTTTALMFPLLVFTRSEQTLIELANIDDLTKLFNRRAFFIAANEAFRDTRMQRGNLTVLMLDLDYFKEVNDTWGHSVGDECLQWVARCLKRELRDTDILARVGGEEFAIALPGVNKEKAQALGKRLCFAVAEQPLTVDGNTIPLSISIGGALCSDKHRDFQMLLSDADQALYKAKDNGRNQLVFA